jgi:hypothetical protein
MLACSQQSLCTRYVFFERKKIVLSEEPVFYGSSKLHGKKNSTMAGLQIEDAELS